MPEGGRGGGEGGGKFEEGSERSREEIETTGETTEEREKQEKREKAKEVLRLLADIIEKGAEWQPDVLQQKRALVQQMLQDLGVTDVTDDNFFQILYTTKDYRPAVPKDYPSFEDFSRLYERTMDLSVEISAGLRWRRAPRFSQVVSDAYADWQNVEGRMSQEVVPYLYGLGKVMCDRKLYQNNFPDHDKVQVRPDGRLQNGRHRVLAAKCLGANYIQYHGFDKYIDVELEEDD